MEKITFSLGLGDKCIFQPDYNTIPTLSTFEGMIAQGSGITAFHVRSRTAPMSAGQFTKHSELFAEDLTTLGTMLADGGHSKQDKSDSIIKALNFLASKITVFVERFKDENITSNHDFSKIPRADLEVLTDLFPES